MTATREADYGGTYDRMSDAEWRRVGWSGDYARRQQYQTIRASIDMLKQQGLIAPEFIMGMEQELRRIVQEHRTTLRWRREQQKRRDALR